MEMEANQILQKRKLLTKTAAKDRREQQRKPHLVTQGSYLGVDSNVSINGNPVAIVKTSAGIARHELIVSGQMLPGSLVNIAKSPASQYGFVVGMPH
ncbi:MAG TPA: hypothetical protein DCY88_07730 [Cyanobacteria bacterium UBA11372]|nr:hypothetical protein [Cyanobacteria bacterium UBA11372]